MRYIRYAFLASIAVILITLALANRSSVTLSLLPEELAGLVGDSGSVQVPLFLVIFASIAVGLLIGFIWEWMREYKHRAEASRSRREVGKLTREVDRLKGSAAKAGGQDDVLALLDESPSAR
jgi:uncharacterized integral membrane protein